MAAISANGAHKLAAFERTFQSSGGCDMTWKSTYVITSDGRLLYKTGDSGYTVAAKVKNLAGKSALDLINIARAYATKRGFTEVH